MVVDSEEILREVVRAIRGGDLDAIISAAKDAFDGGLADEAKFMAKLMIEPATMPPGVRPEFAQAMFVALMMETEEASIGAVALVMRILNESA